MKIGRSFTNLLYKDFLDEENREKLMSGEYEVHDIDALVQVEAKKDISRQIEAAEEMGMDHVELDGSVPNPYLEFTEEEKEEAREEVTSSDISLSFHLPYTYVAECLCAPAERDRQMAANLLKRYIDFASEIGCVYLNAHPGAVPFYHAEGKYLEKVRENLTKSLIELGNYASDRELVFHIENNVAFDTVFVEPEELIPVVEDIRSEGTEVYFNFDIGHWFTRADAGKDISMPPEDVIKKIPAEMVKEFHLNDYVPGEQIFHPPLQDQEGLLMKDNLERYADLVEKKGAELIVVETAFRTREQVKNRDEILKEETEYLREFFG